MQIANKDLNALGNTLAGAADELRKAAEDIDKGLPGNIDTTSPEFIQRLTRVRKAMSGLQAPFAGLLAGVGELSPQPPGETTSVAGAPAAASADQFRSPFKDFLTQVGAALLAAQRDLDKESRVYLDQTLGQQHILPSIFRVPKLSANMKFALEKSHDQGIDLVFFSKSDQAKELHQQSVEFEIVSAPAPVEAVRLRGAPRLDVVLERGLRSLLLAAIQNAAEVRSDLPDGYDPDRVILLRASDNKHIILYANSESKNSVGLWIFDATPPQSFKQVYSFKKTASANEVLLRDLVLEIGDVQVNFLRSR